MLGGWGSNRGSGEKYCSYRQVYGLLWSPAG